MPAPPLDYIVFAAVVLVSSLALWVWITRSGRLSVREFLYSLLWLLPLLGAGFLFVERAGDMERERVFAGLVGFAPTYAREMELLDHERVGMGTDPRDSVYLRMIEAEKRWLAANPGVDDIYTVRRLEDGRYVFVVDSETDYDRNGEYDDDREARTDIGEEMLTSSPEYLETALGGVSVVDPNIETDRWGTWIAAYAPIRGSNGKPESILGVDYRAEAFLARIARARAGAIGAVAVVTLVLLFLSAINMLLTANLREKENRERELQASASRVEALNRELEDKVRERTKQLQSAIRELEDFAYSVSHDLRTPLRSVEGFADLVLTEHAESLPPEARDDLLRVQRAGRRMADLIDDLLRLSRISRAGVHREEVDVTRAARSVAASMPARHPGREVEVRVAPGLRASADPALVDLLFEHLLSNAWKYTARREPAHVEVGRGSDGAFFVRDDGCGFDMRFADKLFKPFQRLCDEEEFEGNGVGLATVARIVELHGGRVWAEAEPERGATFYFTLERARS